MYCALVIMPTCEYTKTLVWLTNSYCLLRQLTSYTFEAVPCYLAVVAIGKTSYTFEAVPCYLAVITGLTIGTSGHNSWYI